MSLMSFMKEAGEKLFGGGTAQAATPASNPDAANQAAADAIVTYSRAQNLDAENLSVKFDGASSAVTVSGQASDQETKEKILLCCGNVAGVEHVGNPWRCMVPSWGPAPQGASEGIRQGQFAPCRAAAADLPSPPAGRSCRPGGDVVKSGL